MSSKNIYSDEWRRDLIKNPPKVASTYSKEEWEHIVMNELCDIPFMTGKKHTDETREKMSRNNARYFLGKKLPEETKQKMSLTRTGKKHSEETKQMMSERRLGENNPFYGKTHDRETIDKMIEKRLPKLRKKVMIDGIVFISQKHAAEHFGVSKACITAWVKKGKAKRVQ